MTSPKKIAPREKTPVRRRRLSRALTVLAVVVLALGTSLGADALPLSSDHALTRNDLWRVVHYVCEPLSSLGITLPCRKVAFVGPGDEGYAILQVSATHILATPITRVTGIEDPAILRPGAPNYWQAAWDARQYLAPPSGRPLGRGDIALAINSREGRTQDQLHIHISCVRKDIRAALDSAERSIGPTWSAFVDPRDGDIYRVRKFYGEDFGATNLFGLITPPRGASGNDMSGETLVAVGARFADGRDGFYLLNRHSANDSPAHGEAMTDHRCKVAAGG